MSHLDRVIDSGDEESPQRTQAAALPEAATSDTLSRELVMEQQRRLSLLAALADLGLTWDEANERAVETPEFTAARQREEAALKEARLQLDRVANDLLLAEEAKREILPVYERHKKNAELKDRVDALKREIGEEESTLKSLDSQIRLLDTQLSTVTAQYKKKREQRQAFLAQFGAMTRSLLAAVAHKLNATSEVDNEDSEAYINPGDCIEVGGQLATSRERAHLIVDKRLREIQWACDFKTNECDTLREENERKLQSVRDVRDEAIRSYVYGVQDERNRLLADVEELITVTSDQALNLRLGHVHVNAQDRLRFDPVPLSRRTVMARPAITDAVRTAPSTRVSAFCKPVEVSSEVRHLAEKNKEMLLDIAAIKTEISKVAANRTDAIQTLKKLQNQIQRNKEHFSSALEKLESQIFAEHAAIRQIEADNSKQADLVEHLSLQLRTNKKHIEHSRTRTMPLPVE